MFCELNQFVALSRVGLKIELECGGLHRLIIYIRHSLGTIGSTLFFTQSVRVNHIENVAYGIHSDFSFDGIRDICGILSENGVLRSLHIRREMVDDLTLDRHRIVLQIPFCGLLALGY